MFHDWNGTSKHWNQTIQSGIFAPPRAAHSNPPVRMNLAWHFLRLKLGTTNFGGAFVGRAVHASLNRFACRLAMKSDF